MRANTIGLIAGTIAVSASVQAANINIGDVLNMTRGSNGFGANIYYNYTSSVAYNASGAGRSYSLAKAGIQNWAVNSVNGTNTFGYNQIAFCVEVEEGAGSPVDYTVVAPANVPENSPPGPMGSARSTLVQDLYSRYYESTVDPAGGTSWGDSINRGVAFQYVIWEISHENFSDTDLSTMVSEMDVANGAMVAFGDSSGSSLDAGVLTEISAMIGALGSGGWNTYAGLFGLTNPTNQDLLIVVPTPAIAGLAGLGLVGMRRRRR
jgi:hypothetical protein